MYLTSPLGVSIAYQNIVPLRKSPSAFLAHSVFYQIFYIYTSLEFFVLDSAMGCDMRANTLVQLLQLFVTTFDLMSESVSMTGVSISMCIL